MTGPYREADILAAHAAIQADLDRAVPEQRCENCGCLYAAHCGHHLRPCCPGLCRGAGRPGSRVTRRNYRLAWAFVLYSCGVMELTRTGFTWPLGLALALMTTALAAGRRFGHGGWRGPW
jgi:hypothetical protein